MNEVNALSNLKLKNRKYLEINEVFKGIEKTILDFKIDAFDDVMDVVNESNIFYIDLFSRKIVVDFKNKFNRGVVEFYLEKSNAERNNYIYLLVASVTTDKRGNVECKELGIKNELYENIHYEILNYILDKS